MRRFLRTALWALPLVSCGGPPHVTPPVFPLKSAWNVPLGGLLQGELASDGRAIFALRRDGSITALEPEHGVKLWESPASGVTGGLLAVEGAVLLHASDGTLLRFEPDSGAVRWRAKTEVVGDLPPAVAGDRVYVAGRGAACLDLATGETQWTVSDGQQATAPPVVFAETLLVGEQDGTLRARETRDGTTRWAHATGAPLYAAPVVDDHRRVLVGTTARRFIAVSLDKGERLWQWRVAADIRTPAAVLGGSVLVGSYEGVLYALNRRNGNLNWRATLPSRPRSGPLLVGTAVVLACYETDVVGFDGLTGKRLGALKVQATLATAPLLIGTRIFAGLTDHATVAAADLAVAVTPEPAAVPSGAPSSAPSASASPGDAPSPGASGSPGPVPSIQATPTPKPGPFS